MTTLSRLSLLFVKRARCKSVKLTYCKIFQILESNTRLLLAPRHLVALMLYSSKHARLCVKAPSPLNHFLESPVVVCSASDVVS